MNRFVVAGVLGLALLAGCGRAGGGGGDDGGAAGPVSTSGSGVAPTVTAGPAVSVPPTAAPPGTATAPVTAPVMSRNPTGAVDLEPVDVLLVEVDRALVEAEPVAEDDPVR